MLKQETIFEIFKKAGALLEGHFLLSSGLHSSRYLQCALVLQHPQQATSLCSSLATRLLEVAANPEVVVAPALGGIIVAHEVGRALGVRAVFAERRDGVLTLRRGFHLNSSERCLVVEDVITTGKSSRETIDVVTRAGGEVLAAGSLIDRGGGAAELGVPSVALAVLQIPTYPPQHCPLCLEGSDAIKPGSRWNETSG